MEGFPVYSADASRQELGTEAEQRSGLNPEEDLAPRSFAERVAILWRRHARRVGSGALLGVALALGWSFVMGQNGISSWNSKRLRDQQLTEEIDHLNAENSRLGQHIERLKDDPAAIEFEARARLHYARPDEVIYALPASSGSDGSPTTASPAAASEPSH